MKVKYYINEKKRTITAVLILENSERYEIANYILREGLYGITYNVDADLHHTYVGMATCLPEDTWDVEYGKTIARRKAYGKYLTARTKKMGQIVTAVDKLWHQVSKKEIEFWNKSSEYCTKTDELAGFDK